MKKSVRAIAGAAAAAAIVAFAASPASAQAAKCQAAIAKNITKYQATVMKTIIGCHKGRSAGKIVLATNCNNPATADTKGKLGGAEAKIGPAIAKACTLPDSQAVLDQFPRCPSPSSAVVALGDTTGIDTFAELSACLVDLSEQYVSRAALEIMGAPSAVLDKPRAACQGAIGKAASKAMATAGKERAKCQATQVKGGGSLDYDACATVSNAKINDALTAVTTAINASCNLPQDDLASIGLCGQNTAALNACVVSRVVRPIGNGLVAAAHELPGICPTHADVVTSAGFGAKLSNTRLDSGFTGLAHRVDIVDGFLGGVRLENCDADCENCDVELDPTNGYCRCDMTGPMDLVSSTIECTTVNGPDAACGGGNCSCMFGPPLPLSSGGSPVCVVNRFSGPFDGTTGAVGEYDVGTRTRAVVHTGINAVKPCPTCDGDPIANDGTLDGTCAGGVRNGLACDRNATHPDFGPTSFDCPPVTASNISGTGLGLALRFTSGTQSITAAIANPAQCSGGTCHCSQCSGDTTVGCTGDADCAAVGAGTCTAISHISKPHECDTTCTAAGDGLGDCDGPVETFCSGFLRQNGKPILPCLDNSSCDALDSECPGGDCGTCTEFALRSCFLPTIAATGVPGIFNSEGISTFCTAATSNSGVNAAGGLPGPGRVRLDFDFNLRCDDNSTQFELPGGSNCP